MPDPFPLPPGFAQEFARAGLHISPGGGPAPARFQVLGERSSGTNLLHRLMIRNASLEPARVLGWKHGFPPAIAIPGDMVVLCVVRDARSWALSMHRKPWHASPALQRLPFSEFLRAPWDSRVDRARHFPGAGPAGLVGQVLQQDRHPLTGALFGNLFALRRAKLQGLLGYLNRGCHVAVLRMEQLQADPETTLAALLAGLRLPHPEPFRPVHRRLGSKFKPAVANRPPTPDRMADDDLAFLRGTVDPEFEARLGYVY